MRNIILGKGRIILSVIGQEKVDAIKGLLQSEPYYAGDWPYFSLSYSTKSD